MRGCAAQLVDRAGCRAALIAAAALTGAAVAVTPGGADAQTPAVGAVTQARPGAPPFSGNALVDPPATGWPTNGGNWYNQRYSPLDAIDRGNVSRLKGVWRARLGGSGVGTQYSGEAQPLVHEGVLYVVTGADDVFAIDVETGETLWSYEAHLDPGLGGVICCGWTSRGVGLGDGKVYVGQLDGKLVALDQHSGDAVWSVQAERPEEGFSITSAPLYYDGLVITGFAGAEYGIRGRVKAYDADDGELAWTFFTIPGPGELGHDTWPDNDVWRHGGASVWQTPAVDPQLGLIYFSTGNPGPDYNGGVRPGDNLFSASIVALDAKSGEYRWHFQQVHHDLWDYDGPSPVVLFDIELDGRLRRGLAQASKTGWVYILDRTDGTPLLGIEERPVPQEPRQATSPTQPYPVGDAFVPQSIDIAPEGYTLVNGGRIFTPFWTDAPVILKPSISGGANWPPSSYDPATGYLYVCAQDRIGVFRAEEIDDSRPEPGTLYAAGMFGAPTLPRMGVFAALDMHTNRLVWQQLWNDECYSGSVATAGGLVFVGRNDGRLTALDSSDGTKLWEFQTGAGMNAPVTVFEHDGRQFVAAYSAGNLFAGSPRGDSVWLFGLDGPLDPVPPASAVMALPRGIEARADLDNGASLYAAACAYCHGDGGDGGQGGGPELGTSLTLGAVVQAVNEGRNDMPAFGAALGEDQIRDVAAFVLELR